MRKQILLCMFATAVMSTVNANDKLPDTACHTAAYSSGEGYQAWIARYGPEERHEPVAQIAGSKSLPADRPSPHLPAAHQAQSPKK